jgi:hypothetical protein
MSIQKRLVKIQGSLRPEQAVLLLIHEARETESFYLYCSGLHERPPSECPCNRINREVASAIRLAMKGKPAELVEKAVRSAAMEADFLLVLAFRVNEEVLNHADARQLGLQLLLEQVQHRGENWMEEEHEGWIGRLLLNMSEVLVLKMAVERIEREHFRGNSVLFRDAVQALDDEFRLAQEVCEAYDRVVAGCPDSAVDLGPVSEFLQPLTAFRASHLVAKAKSDMLREFSGSEAAISSMRRFWIDWPPEAVTLCLEQRFRKVVST